jgi:thiamine-phosphate pyrophosphorylase
VGSARCQLYLIGPAAVPSPALIEEALEAAEIACFLLPPDEASPDDQRRIVALVQARGIACLIADDTALAVRLGADGVHLSEAEAYEAARSALGRDRIVGVGCGRSRHAAMEAGERGADYVAFAVATGEDVEAVRDWTETTVVPCVAWIEHRPIAADAVAAGADFLAVGDVWTDPAGPAAALRGYAEQARRAGG